VLTAPWAAGRKTAATPPGFDPSADGSDLGGAHFPGALPPATDPLRGSRTDSAEDVPKGVRRAKGGGGEGGRFGWTGSYNRFNRL
jgi:hypothetical protein